MPIIKGWFKEDKFFDWEKWNNAYQYNGIDGPEFNAYPLNELIPRIIPDLSDIENSTSPTWIIEIDSSLNIGKINHKGEGTYIISLPETFGSYLDSLTYEHRKKLRYSLKRNQDIEVVYDKYSDIDSLWNSYIQKIDQLNIDNGLDKHSAEVNSLRKELYTTGEIQTISFYLQGTLLAVNVCRVVNGEIFDLACLRADSEETRKRGLGVYATLINIQRSIEDSREIYDMLPVNYGYKTQFGAKEVKLRHFLKCNRQFAEAYKIDLEDVTELIS